MPQGDTAGVDATTRVGRALHGHWRWLAAANASGIVDCRDGVLVAATGLPDRTLNPAFVVHAPADAAGAVNWAVHRRASLVTQSTGFDLPAGRFPDVESALADAGYITAVRRPGMVAELRSVRQATRSPELAVRVVRTTEDWTRYTGVQESVFDLSSAVASGLPPYGALHHSGATLLVGAVDDVVVTAACVVVTGPDAAISGVATLRGHERQGHGTAITYAAAGHAAALGATHAALQATAEGLPLYRRLGFVECGDWAVWVDPAVG